MTVLWTPTQKRIDGSNQKAFERFLAERGLGPFVDFDSLHSWSVGDQNAFYDAVWDFFDLVGEKGDTAFVAPTTDDIRSAQYFPHASMSYAENLLRWAEDGTFADQPALLFDREDGCHRSVSWKQLKDLVGQFQAYLLSQGVGEGDRVAALIPNCPEAIAILLAANSLGAITSTASPDFGVSGLLIALVKLSPRCCLVSMGTTMGVKRLIFRTRQMTLQANSWLGRT